MYFKSIVLLALGALSSNSCEHETHVDLFDYEMTFFKPRTDDFPMLPYAFESAEKNGSYTIAYNAANEVAVADFISEKIGFTDIPKVVRYVLDKDWTNEPKDFNEVFELDKLARKIASEAL